MTARRLTIILLALWTLVWLGSFALPATLAPTGDSFTKGLNRVMAFFGMQIGAGVIGLLLIFVRPPQGRLRWFALVPAAMAGLLILVMVVLIFWAERSSPYPVSTMPPTAPATTAPPVTPPVTAPAD